MDINTVMTFIKDVVASLMILVSMISPFAQNEGVAYEAENPDALITSFVAVSDIHVETNFPESYQNLKDVLYGIKAGKDISTVVYTGDNVMNGQVTEDFLFYSAVKAVKPAKNNLVVVGNHDVGNGEGDYSELREKFLSNNALYLGNRMETDYYYRVVDGCYFIILSSEDDTAQSFSMTEEQFTWLQGVLEKAKEDDARIFVFNHFPLRYLGDAARLGKLLSDYGVELFIHGHIHNDMGADNFYTSYGVDCINLPRITEVHEYQAGDGIVVEVYENEIVVRARDFIKGEWIEGLRYTY